MCVHVFVFLCICIYVSVSMHVCLLYVCSCVFVCVHICLCVYIFTCMNLKSQCKLFFGYFLGTLPNFLRKGILLNQELKQFSKTNWLINPASLSLMLRIESFGTLCEFQGWIAFLIPEREALFILRITLLNFYLS